MEFRNYLEEAIRAAECILLVAYTVTFMCIMFVRFS